MELAEVQYYFPAGKWTSSFFIYLIIYSANHMVVTTTQKPPKLETWNFWTDYKSIHELVYLQFWRRYVTWFRTYAPNLLQQSLFSDFDHVFARAALAEWFKAPVLES